MYYITEDQELELSKITAVGLLEKTKNSKRREEFKADSYGQQRNFK